MLKLIPFQIYGKVYLGGNSMNLKQALYIQTIAEEGGITAAAKKLYISQPSLSQMLHQIEDDIGLSLFDRSSFPVRPTYAGECYLRAAARMLNTQDILEHELQEIRQEDRGRIRLGISIQRSVHLLPRVLPQFIRQYPLVSLTLQEAGSADLEQRVLDSQVDLALASTEAACSGLTYRLLQKETVGILAGAGSPLARSLDSGTPISLEEALDTPFIALKQGHNVRVIQEKLFQALGQRPQILLETDSLEAARQLTLSCGCCMLCTDSYVGRGEAFYPLKNYQNSRHFYACYENGRMLPRYMEFFIELIVQMLGLV